MENMNKASIQLLNDCRELMTERLSQSLNAMMDRADGMLLEMSDMSSTASARLKYQNAMRELKLNRKEIETDFLTNFSGLFDSSIQVTQGGNSVRAKGQHVSIKKFDFPEESIALSNTVTKVKYKCRDALLSLDKRMGKLLDDPQLKKQKNPIRPEAVCTAFHDACKNIKSDLEVRLILFRLFEKYVAMDLYDGYSQVNALIDRKGDRTMIQNEQLKSSGMVQMQIANSHIHDKTFVLSANGIIKDAIKKCIGKYDLPDFASEFLFNHWSRLMLKIYIRDGAKGEAWQHAIDVIDDLAEYINNGKSATEIKKHAGAFPSLEQRLKFGLNVISITKDAREKFFTALSAPHKASLQHKPSVQETSKGKTTLDDILADEDSALEETSTPFGAELFFDDDAKD